MIDFGIDKKYSDLLFQIYEPPENEDFFGHVLRALDSCVESELSAHSCTNLSAKKLQPQTINRNGAGGKKAPSLDVIPSNIQIHPFREEYYKNTRGPVLCISDFSSETQWSASEFYNEIWTPAGLLHDTSVRFYEEGNCHSFFFSGPVPLSKECRNSLELIAPHIGNAYHSFKMQQNVTEDIPDNMILLSDKGRLINCSASAVAQLNTYFLGSTKASVWGLPEEVERWIRVRVQSFSFPGKGNEGRSKLFARRGRRVLSLSLLRFKGNFVLLLEESISVRTFDVLQKMGLTHREVEVMLWVYNGKQNSEIALILQISTATVRKHVEHVFQKLNCETRGEAVQMVVQNIFEQREGVEPEKCSICSLSICKFC